MSSTDLEKNYKGDTAVVNTDDVESPLASPPEEHEVFRQTADGENYRTVSW